MLEPMKSEGMCTHMTHTQSWHTLIEVDQEKVFLVAQFCSKISFESNCRFASRKGTVPRLKKLCMQKSVLAGSQNQLGPPIY